VRQPGAQGVRRRRRGVQGFWFLPDGQPQGGEGGLVVLLFRLFQFVGLRLEVGLELLDVELRFRLEFLGRRVALVGRRVELVGRRVELVSRGCLRLSTPG
jgi:hypothetical protein